MPTVNARIAAVSAAKGQAAAVKAFAQPVRVSPMGKHPHLRPTASGQRRK